MNKKMSTMSMNKIIKKFYIPTNKIIKKKSLMILSNQVKLEERFGIKVLNKVLLK
jgi:hypothetical protein